MQFLGAVSLLACVISMLAVLVESNTLALCTFAVALVLMASSLACLIWEVWISGGALRIMLTTMEDELEGKSSP